MTPNANRGSAHGAHPIDQLEAEHQVILRIIDVAEQELDRMVAGGPIRREFWNKYLEFFGAFSEQSQHSEREDVLFAALESQGVPHDAGPTCCLRAEHAEMQSIRARTAEALTSDDKETIAHLVRLGHEELKQHLRMENADVFPLARELLDDALLAKVREGFDALEARKDEAAIARYNTLAEELCAARPGPETK